MKQRVLEYNCIFQREKDGGFSVWVPSLLGCTSQGDTFEEALENVKEAIILYLEDQEGVPEDVEDVRSQFMVSIKVKANE
ncbi:hypothetical protein A3H26_03680 [candidate division WWE3 bacterium RIFCSPLOWO2_12_FULL_36_10]|uniref:HicB-like antitoxin of toxin-antitoxin system domain-containing protein n=1 Tax=candidate division WWE3 bacterium RIFCSPLOWO2_12_FULL_36_10 TaxID=1802630 RepID=A0A1F4VG50_UNCKA|nr:MAG: hypothetical protein A3H26_03680 [candidate division WWE3 bacterium RIFCSPLOWO2_12_FULL_36_10]